MTYGIIFWANSYYSKVIFQLQKRVIRIIIGIRNRESCREHFRTLKILPLQSQYILSLLLFMIDNKDHFKRNFEVHHINTRNKSSLHQPLSYLLIYQKGAYCTGIRVFNSLPPQIIDNILNIFWRNFYIFTHFIHGRNILIARRLTISSVVRLLCPPYFKFLHWYLIFNLLL